MSNSVNKIYDLAERTSVFSERIIDFCRPLVLDKISQSIVSQLIRSATSIGANYMEAKNGSSKKDFTNKIYICKKETQETEYWIRLIHKCFPSERDKINSLSSEAHELLLIFQKIISSAKLNNLKLN